MPAFGPNGAGIATTPVKLSDWLEETLNLLYRANNRPAQLSLGPGGTGLTTAVGSDNTCTLNGLITTPSTTTVNVPSIVEMGEEMLLVTARSTDSNPVFTVSRGYAGTPLQAHSAGDPVIIAPDWGRYQTRRHLLRGIQGPIATVLPCVRTAALAPTVNTYYLPAPSDCILPLSLAYVQTDLQGIVKRFEEITEWEFRQGVDPSISSSGMLITVPPVLVTGNLTGVQTVKTIYLTYQAPYTWSGGQLEPAGAPGGEAETLLWRPYAQDLPPLYAAAFSLTGREIARTQVDKVEYWNQEINFRQGVDQKIGMSAWQRYYKRLEECQGLDRSREPKHRPFRRMHRATSGAVGW